MGGFLDGSLSGSAEIESVGRKGEGIALDKRIWGRGEFVKRLLLDGDELERESLRLSGKFRDLGVGFTIRE